MLLPRHERPRAPRIRFLTQHNTSDNPSNHTSDQVALIESPGRAPAGVPRTTAEHIISHRYQEDTMAFLQLLLKLMPALAALIEALIEALKPEVPTQ